MTIGARRAEDRRAGVEMRRLAGSDLALSTLGYGAWVTGTDTLTATIDRDALERAIRAAIDAGMRWVDTAELYASGASEELVGRVVATSREEVFVATKVAPIGAGTGMRPAEIRRAVRGSLRRLGTDHIDLYQLHWYDSSVPLEETWGAMREAVDDGLARYVGVSNFDRALVERCLAVGPVDSVQNQLSLLHRDDLGELLPWLRDRGIAYLAYGSLAFGLLSGGITEATRFDGGDWRSGRTRFETNYYEELFAPDRIERNLGVVRDLAPVADELGLPVSVLALRWALEKPGVTALVVGSLNPDHIRTNARAGSALHDSSVLARVDDLIDRHVGAEERAGES